MQTFLSSHLYTRFTIAVLLNAVLAVTQIIYANRTHSVSLLSDALHNLGDVFGLFLAWVAQVVSKFPATRSYTYGYKKLTVLATLGNATLLLGSVGFILYETITKFQHTHAVSIDVLPVIVIAMLGVLVNGGAALLFMHEKDINIRAAFLHLVLDTLTSVGVVVSAVVIYYTGYQWIDAVIASIIGFIILLSSLRLLRRSFRLLLNAVPENIDVHAIQNYLIQLPGVNTVENLHIWPISTQETALTAHLSLKASEVLKVNHTKIQKDLSEQFHISHVTLQVLPSE